tara:strand:+ start:1259 stop:2425 length:1167 start_codon:yes stop_codon:yes gene_type:complete
MFTLVTISFDTFKKTKQEPAIAVMAYYVAGENFDPSKLPLDKLTHIIFSFTKIIDNEMKFQNNATADKLRLLVQQRDKYPNLKIMVACGGWGADGFSDMANSVESRQKFVLSIVEFNREFNIDGLDIDWEYPTIPAAQTNARPEDKKNFTLLMKGLREALNTLNRKQTLTFASAGWKQYYKNIELKEVIKYVDYMNIMTYDQIGSNSPFTGHHTPLGWIKEKDMVGTPAEVLLESRKAEMKEGGKEYEPGSVESIVEYCIKAGVPSTKIVVGAAFYGRAWKGVSSPNNGLYQANSGSYLGWSSYSQIREEYENNSNYKRFWDSVAKAPFLYSKKDEVFMTYDDTVSVKLKVDFAKERRLGGIMFWQLGLDTKEKNSLLNAIFKEANAK